MIGKIYHYPIFFILISLHISHAKIFPPPNTVDPTWLQSDGSYKPEYFPPMEQSVETRTINGQKNLVYQYGATIPAEHQAVKGYQPITRGMEGRLAIGFLSTKPNEPIGTSWTFAPSEGKPIINANQQLEAVPGGGWKIVNIVKYSSQPTQAGEILDATTGKKVPLYKDTAGNPLIKDASGVYKTVPDNWLQITGYKDGMPGYFKPVSDNLNLADYHYVGTHNSHTYPRFFTTVRQQDTDFTGQLNNGVRGFMPDTYPFDLSSPNVKVGNGSIIESHGTPGTLAFSQKGFTSTGIVEYQTYRYDLKQIIDFLKKWPSEIVIVIVENYADIKILAQETLDTIKECGEDLLFKPSDWEPEADMKSGKSQTHTWPTIGWMRKNNKRLMIVVPAAGKDTCLWDHYPYFINNKWGMEFASGTGGYDPDNICTVYRNPSNATLNYINQFSELAVTRAVWDVKRDHRYQIIKDLDAHCKTKNWSQGRGIRGYFGDRIVDSTTTLNQDGEKTVYDYMNEKNSGQ